MVTLRPAIMVSISASMAAGGRAPQPGPRSHQPSRRNSGVRLGVPPDYLPAPGQYRVWVPGTPPGRQTPPRFSNVPDARGPAGSVILYRPERDRTVVYARYVDEHRPGVVARVHVFEAATGRHLRDERP